MKTTLAAILALGLLSGAASAASNPFSNIGEAAPRAQTFADLGNTAPRSVFSDLGTVAPRSTFEEIRDTSPRSDGVFGTVKTQSP